jgi:dTDP-4-dehydrorhamnose 3,5-epimerase
VIIRETRLGGALLIEPEPVCDERGFFARVWCDREAAAHGLVTRPVQASVSYNERAGTLRGLHYQRPPHGEAKLVRCTRGAIFDVIVDLRADSPTRLEWQSFELDDCNRHTLFIPAGFAHGFQSLTDGAEVYYQISEYYVADAAAGLRYDDPAFDIPWPLPVSVISQKDAALPRYEAGDRPANNRSSSRGQGR